MSPTVVQGRLEHIPVKQVRENPAALREVDQGTEKWAEFVSNVRARGVLKPILVHEKDDPENPGQKIYGLSDGLHRVTAAKAAGLDTIPANIVPLEEAEVLETQLMLNFHVIATKPIEFSKGIVRMLGLNPTMTMTDLCNKLNVNSGWLNQRLSLLKLKEEYQALVEENKLNLTNAYALAKLPVEEQPNFIDRAMTEQPDVFVQVANERAKALKDAQRKGNAASAETFVATPHVKKVAELKEEYESGVIASAFKGKGIISDTDAFKMGVAWSLHMDPMSVEAARIAWEAKQKDKAEKERKRLAESAEKKKQEADKILQNLAATAQP